MPGGINVCCHPLSPAFFPNALSPARQAERVYGQAVILPRIPHDALLIPYL
jgi:hypothetical protein